MTASTEKLSEYLGREAGLDVPVHIASEDMDLSADLKRALSYARGAKNQRSEGEVVMSKACPLTRVPDGS